MSYFPSSFAVFVCLLLSVWLNSLPAQDAEMSTQRWAVIAADTNSQSLADLLTVELTALDHVELVEREQIRIVMEELALSASGLVDPDRSLQFGQLSQADALVIIDAPADQNAKRQDLRVRLIDTRTSIRLWDTLLPRHNIDDEVSAIVTELRTATKVLSIPMEQIRAIGITRIVSGEAGHFLSPYCRTLEALLAAELFCVPEVVVLERSDLQRLTAESRLSGIQLQLRAATRLLEISVRRSADDGILLHSTTQPAPSWIDRNSLAVTLLPEFSAAVAANRHDQPSFVSPHVGSYTLEGSFPKTRLIKIGEHLVSSNCRMITADGHSHSLDCLPFYVRWLSLQRFGRGFLAHYDSSRQTLWYVEPK